MIGHSIGEYVGACLGGIFSLEDALSLVVKRGALMQKMPRGKMLSLLLSTEELSPHLSKYPSVNLAAENSSSRVVVAGPSESIKWFGNYLSEKGIDGKELATSHAFHSSMMDGMVKDYRELLEGIEMERLKYPILSNVSGQLCHDSEMSKVSYWLDQLRQPVMFSSGLGQIMQEDEVVFLEVGPSGGLTSFVRNHKAYKKGHQVVRLLGGQRYKGNTQKGLVEGLGKLWSKGIEIDWEKYYSQEKRNKISVPGYSFEKTKYPVDVWPKLMVSKMILNRIRSDEPTEEILKGAIWKNPGEITPEPIHNWFYTPTWQLSPQYDSRPEDQNVGCTLVLMDSVGVGEDIIQKLRKLGEEVICVQIGSPPTKEFLDNTFFLNLGEEQSYYQLIEKLAHKGLVPTRIIHCWGITAYSFEKENLDEIHRYFYSLFHLVKACHLQKMGLEKIIVLTNGLHDVTNSGEMASPLKSLGIAYLKVLAQEYPILQTAHIDISLSEELEESLRCKIFKEIQNFQPGGIVAFRHSRRWVQVFEKLEINRKPEEENLRREGVYLITGGLGNLGSAISKFFE